VSVAILVAGEADSAAWDHFVDDHPGATGYHSWAWRQVFQRAFRHHPIYLVARRADAVVGVLPLVEMRSLLFGRFLVSLPFVNYGGVLATDHDVERALFEHAIDIAAERRLNHIELRHFTQHFAEAPTKWHKVAMLMPLESDPETTWTALDRKVRNQVRKAEKSGLTFETGGRELVDAFYPVFARNMRDLGTPVYPKRLFLEVLAALPDRARIFLVRTRDGVPAAAGVGVNYRRTTEMPWAASLKQYRAMCPNNLLYWGAIRYAINRGASTFDFGRSTPHEGTYNFKAQWGARAVPLCWEYCLLRGGRVPDQSPKNSRFSLAISGWKRLPVAIANWAGPSIVRSIP